MTMWPCGVVDVLTLDKWMVMWTCGNVEGGTWGHVKKGHVYKRTSRHLDMLTMGQVDMCIVDTLTI